MLALVVPPAAGVAGPRILHHAAAPAPAQPALKIQSKFGGLAFLNTGSSLRGQGVSVTHRLVLSCASRTSVRPFCGAGAPGATPSGGSLAPDLSSGSADLSVDLKFVHAGRSLSFSSGTLSGHAGIATLSVRIGGREVALGTCHPHLKRTIEDVTLSDSTLALTAAGASALNHSLGTHLKAGGVLTSRFGGNVVFTQADIASGNATFALPGSLGTVTPTGTASSTGAGLKLLVVAATVPLTRDSYLNGRLHYHGGFSFTSRGQTVSVSGVSVQLNGTTIDHRVDDVYAQVNGHSVELATASQGFLNEQEVGSQPVESDFENPVKLTAAGAKALGGAFHAGESFGSLTVTSYVPH